MADFELPVQIQIFYFGRKQTRIRHHYLILGSHIPIAAPAMPTAINSAAVRITSDAAITTGRLRVFCA